MGIETGGTEVGDTGKEADIEVDAICEWTGIELTKVPRTKVAHLYVDIGRHSNANSR